MARIQILPLPTVKLGEAEHTPFVIVLDQFAADEAWEPEYFELLRHETGAVSVPGYEGTMDATGALDLTDEQRDHLTRYLTQPRQWVADQRYTDPEPRLIPGRVTAPQ